MKFEKEFITQVKQKKELAFLDDDFVLNYIQKYFPKNLQSSLDQYSSIDQALRNKKIKQVISDVRKHLREVYGLFLNTPLTQKDVNEKVSDQQLSFLLEKHKSTEERLPYYATLYPRLLKELEKKGLPEKFTLLDVACGYNPLAAKYFPRLPEKYVACDLSTNEMQLVSKFFTVQGIAGTAFGADVLSEEFMSWLADQSFDVVFFLKALDSFETVQRHSSKKLLSLVHAPLLVVSFPLVSIGGKSSIQSSKRGWFERFCEKEGWSLDSFELPNELFYIIQK